MKLLKEKIARLSDLKTGKTDISNLIQYMEEKKARDKENIEGYIASWDGAGAKKAMVSASIFSSEDLIPILHKKLASVEREIETIEPIIEMTERLLQSESVNKQP